MNAQESAFKNSAAVVFGRNKQDILKEKFNLKEKKLVPAPGFYNAGFSDFSGE